MSYLDRAKQFIGKDERTNTKELDSFFKKHSGWSFSVLTTPWCAAFVNSILAESGHKTTGSFMARSFLKYGTKVDHPQEGDIVVFARGKPPSGHVAFFIKDIDANYIEVLGGNQADKVCRKLYKKNSVLGYRRP